MAEEDEDEEEARTRVIPTTIHRPKGLEADFVHLAGLADLLLPGRFRDTLIDQVRKRREEDHLEEEVRVLCDASRRRVAMKSSRREGASGRGTGRGTLVIDRTGTPRPLIDTFQSSRQEEGARRRLRWGARSALQCGANSQLSCIQ